MILKSDYCRLAATFCRKINGTFYNRLMPLVNTVKITECKRKILIFIKFGKYFHINIIIQKSRLLCIYYPATKNNILIIKYNRLSDCNGFLHILKIHKYISVFERSNFYRCRILSGADFCEA